MAKAMQDCGQFETADDMFAVLMTVEDAARRAFDTVRDDDGVVQMECCGAPVTTTHFIGDGVRARCLSCGAEIVNVTWPMGPLLYDPKVPQCAHMPSDELYERVGAKRWLVVKAPVKDDEARR